MQESPKPETAQKIDNKSSESKNLQGLGSPYPAESIVSSLAKAKEVIEKNGTAQPISKDAICVSLGKKPSTLNLTFSTWLQYGIFLNNHGKGFVPSHTYKSFIDFAYPEDEKRALLAMFKSPPLYRQLIENLNNEVLPPEDRFPTLLKNEPYKINPNSAERASKIFFENARYLGVIDNNNRLRFLLPEKGDTKPLETMIQAPAATIDSLPVQNTELFDLPIPLPKGRIAHLKYPINSLTRRDIRVIAKALEFIASSIGEDDYDETKKEQLDSVPLNNISQER